MKKQRDERDVRAPFAWHGVDFTGENDSQYIGTCPFCGKESHFYLGRENGCWDCKVCQAQGDVSAFLLRCQRAYREAFSDDDAVAEELAAQWRLPVEVISDKRFNFGYDEAHKAVTMLVLDPKGRGVSIRHRVLKTGKVLTTKGCGLGVWGAEQLTEDTTALPVFVTEGESDRVTLTHRLQERGVEAVVVAVPGAGAFDKAWAEWFRGRDVTLLYDHDGAGAKGEQRAFGRLRGHARSLRCVHWPASIRVKHKGTDEARDKPLPPGTDVRDWFTRHKRSWKAFQTLFRSEPRLGLPPADATDKASVDPDAVQRLHDTYVYVEGTAEFVDVRTRRRCDHTALDRRHADQFPLGKNATTPSASQTFWNTSGPTVQIITYRPFRPESLAAFEDASPFIDEQDPETGVQVSAVNVFRPSDLFFRAVEDDAVDDAVDNALLQPYLDFGRQLYGKDLPHLFDYWAFTLQHPHLKANWHPWVISDEGAGKDTFIKPFVAAVGDHNTRSAQGRMLHSEFTDWVERARLILVRDIAKLRDDDWHTLKNYLTHPPERIQVNGKWQRQRWIPNLMHFLFMTNNSDALPVTADGRRLLVLHAQRPQHDPCTPGQPYDPDVMNRYVEREDMQLALCRWLLRRAVDPAKLRGNAPETIAKQLTQEENESELAHTLRRLRDGQELPLHRELFAVGDVVRGLAALTTDLVPRPNEQNVGRALKEARLAEQIGQARLPDGKKVRVWALAQADTYRQLTDVQLGTEYVRQKALAKGFRSTAESRAALLAGTRGGVKAGRPKQKPRIVLRATTGRR